MEHLQQMAQRHTLRQRIEWLVMEADLEPVIVMLCLALLGWAALLLPGHQLSIPNRAALQYFPNEHAWGVAGASLFGLLSIGALLRIYPLLIVALFLTCMFFLCIATALLVKEPPNTAVGNYGALLVGALWAFGRQVYLYQQRRKATDA